MMMGWVSRWGWGGGWEDGEGFTETNGMTCRTANVMGYFMVKNMGYHQHDSLYLEEVSVCPHLEAYLFVVIRI